jgi:N-acetylmuramoyl-L-alanine amidase
MPRVDSTFTFGSVNPPSSSLRINGVPVKVWTNGAFLAFVPLDTVTSQFSFLTVSPGGDTTRKALPFRLMSEARSKGFVTTHPLNQRLPARINITQDGAASRSAPGHAYVQFPPRGTVALADSFAAGCYRIRLANGRHAWIEEKFASLDTTYRDIPVVSVSTMAVRAQDRWTAIEIPLSLPIPFAIAEKPEVGMLEVELFGAVSRLNRMDYDPVDSLVWEIRWQQAEDNLLRLQLFLNSSRIWGYKAFWAVDSTTGRATLTLNIRRPPYIERRPLKGRIIVLDPGHGGSQPGSVGPTRLAEKEPNLNLAVMLKERLEERGAIVFLTRSADSTVELNDRVDFAVNHNAEALLSLHNNALSDGENPFITHGSGVYYYQPHSLDLAQTLRRYLLKGTGLRDNGLYYQNLALCRPTEMPAILIESAFIMHPDEEMLLRDDRFLSRTASSLAEGLEDYFDREK